MVLLCQCSINSQQDQTCPFLVKKESLVPFWVTRPKDKRKEEEKKIFRENRVVEISAFRAEKKGFSNLQCVLQKVEVCSFYLSFSVLTENLDAQNGHNNQSVQASFVITQSFTPFR